MTKQTQTKALTQITEIKTTFLLMGIVLFISLSSAAAPTNQNCDCSNEINSLSINLSIMNQTNQNLFQNLTYSENMSEYYKNLSEYYQELYLNKEINITNRELIQMYNTFNILNKNISNLTTKVENLEKKITIFSFKVGISILSLTGLSVLGIELMLKIFRRKKNENKN